MYLFTVLYFKYSMAVELRVFWRWRLCCFDGAAGDTALSQQAYARACYILLQVGEVCELVSQM